MQDICYNEPNTSVGVMQARFMLAAPIKMLPERTKIMKHSRPMRIGALALALWMLATAAFACTPRPTEPADTATGSETTDVNAPSSDEDSAAVTDPVAPVTPAETGDSADTTTGDQPPVQTPVGDLIGDGVATAGVFPTFSKKGGFFTGRGTTVELSAPEGYTVRYTTDGSVPTKSSTAYKSAIKVAPGMGEGMVIRAACFNSKDQLEGQVITHTYICTDKTESLHYTVMLSTDEENLDAMYADINAKVERAAHVEILSPDGTRIISQDAGLRLFGGSSRSLTQKSFKIIARKDGYFGETEPYVGAGTFSYPFFPERVVLGGKNAGKVLEKFDGLILRNGGNDSLLSTAADPSDPCLLRDGMANEFMFKYAPSVGASLAHFAVVYLNGEYYGILELRENQNEDYVKRIWGVLDDDVVVIKSELDTSRHCGRDDCPGYGCRFCGVWFFYETDETDLAQKQLKDWIALCKKAADNVNADEATYRKIYEELAEKIDLVNVKEYLAVSCYLCNKDWPYNNVRLWRYTGEPIEGIDITDGRFRFATRDMDMTFGRYSSPHILPDIDSRADVDMFEWVLVNYIDGYEDVRESSFPDYPDALYTQGLFAFLLRDDTFRADFAAYCRTLISDEAIAYLKTLYEDAYAQVNPIIGAHIDKWGRYIDGGFSTRNWRKAAERVEKFINARPAQFEKHLERLLSMYD